MLIFRTQSNLVSGCNMLMFRTQSNLVSGCNMLMFRTQSNLVIGCNARVSGRLFRTDGNFAMISFGEERNICLTRSAGARRFQQVPLNLLL